MPKNDRIIRIENIENNNFLKRKIQYINFKTNKKKIKDNTFTKIKKWGSQLCRKEDHKIFSQTAAKETIPSACFTCNQTER